MDVGCDGDLIRILSSIDHYKYLSPVRVGSVCMAICVNVERMYAVVFPLKTVGWRRYMLPVCLAVATLYNIPKVDAQSL